MGGDCKIPGPPPTGAPESVSLGPPSQQSRQLKTHSRLKTTSLAISKRLEDEQLSDQKTF